MAGYGKRGMKRGGKRSMSKKPSPRRPGGKGKGVDIFYHGGKVI